MPHIAAVPALRDNYIWIIRDRRHAVAVDPGDAAPLLGYLRRERLDLAAILVTHRHHDHAGGIPALLQAGPVPVYGPAREVVPGVTHPVREMAEDGCRDDGDAIGEVHVPELSLRLRVLDIPGHTLGHVAYHGAGWLFSGDTLFACGCGRVFEGTAGQMAASLQKLADLPDETGVYCGHEYTLANIRFARTVEPGNLALIEREAVAQAQRRAELPTLPSTLALERATNPFLRCDQPEVIRSASAYAGTPLTDAVHVFAALREWKNRS
ncbi:hydroxyacylglutathione hydrolase [Nitrosovibrio sp. Nv17]|uniref:hydroxyacylglutathione hydrolase n=1 Tax=Nitrosovibrio sp. Nv17 TaxID=1855339 RepID=UPI000908BCC1|nr:hydroxyacylglutathione hydrolase [Nitrosovibrio sp. Nv17]SFW25835.1 hydroxyacylglutathione hydrolase [Nitrosovibrio sp. Nv17]